MSGERDPFASIDAAVEALKNDDALGVFGWRRKHYYGALPK